MHALYLTLKPTLFLVATSYVLLFLGWAINTFSLTRNLKRCFNAIVELVDKIDDRELDHLREAEDKRMRILKKKLLRLGPLTGQGFFLVDQSLLTGMLSFTLTYVIILLQFKIG